MTRLHHGLVALALLGGGAAMAAETAGTVYRLTPDEIAKIDPNPRPGGAAVAYDPLFDKSLYDASDFVKRDRQVHGEVGAFVGSGGARGIFGTAAVPLGDDGFASFSFEQSDYGRRYYRRR